MTYSVLSQIDLSSSNWRDKTPSQLPFIYFFVNWETTTYRYQPSAREEGVLRPVVHIDETSMD
jgi:hypothetical protein